jgi:von Willebrand factor type A domain
MRIEGRKLRAAVAASMVAAGGFVASAPGCSSDIPPPLGYATGSATTDGSSPGAPVINDTPTPRSCNLGPDAGVCACLDVPLLEDAPNMYFVLDHSGSMAELDKWPTAEAVIEQVVLALGPRINVGFASFPDPVNAGCGPGYQLMATQAGDSPAGVIGPTYQELVFHLTTLSPAGGTPTAATLDAIYPTLHALSGKTYAILVTDGGPNCDEGATCTVDQCMVNIESQAPGCTPNTQPNCCDPSDYGPSNCLDSAATIAAVTQLAQGGVPVYVVGVYGSGVYATLLDQLATAGGTAQAAEPLYYRVDGTDSGSLDAALSSIAAKITATCTFTVAGTITQGDLNVFFGNDVVPQDPANGWTLDGNLVTLVGTSCQEVLDGDVLEIHISSGCPTVIR